MRRLLQFFNPKTHITKKVWLSTAAFALASLLFIGALAHLVLSSYFLNSSLTRAVNAHAYTANALEDKLSHIIERFVEVCGTTDFRDMLPKISSATKDNFTQLNNSLQDTLHELTVSDSLIESAVITNRNGLIFRSSSQGIKAHTYSYSLNYPEEEICSIDMLPQMDSPVKGQKDVIPLAFPLSLETQGNFTAVSSSASESDVILFLLLDASGINSFLKAYSDDDTQGKLYLMSAGGELITPISSREADDKTLFAPELTNAMEQRISSGTIRSSDFYILYEEIDERGIYLVNVVSKDKLMTAMHTITQYLRYAALISIFLIAMVTPFVAAYITKPLGRLMDSVRNIEEGTYNSSQVLPQKDEIGQLSSAIDSMYHTIQEQVQEILDERQAKYNAEIRLFAEQINPHFLYNTLEYINMEVYNQHTENAALMIQSLGDFLRIGLNFGSDLITVSQEIRHAQAYINIMNHRFSHSISFNSSVDEQLQDYRILKIILQPLVENSIRHGFLLEGNGSYIAIPSISITVKQDGSRILLSVTDNGVGIDVEKANRIMHTGLDGQRHIGLNNVYQRLKTFYHDDADITFYSIPYYKNTVRIQIPYLSETDHAGGAS